MRSLRNQIYDSLHRDFHKVWKATHHLSILETTYR